MWRHMFNQNHFFPIPPMHILLNSAQHCTCQYATTALFQNIRRFDRPKLGLLYLYKQRQYIYICDCLFTRHRSSFMSRIVVSPQCKKNSNSTSPFLLPAAVVASLLPRQFPDDMTVVAFVNNKVFPLTHIPGGTPNSLS